MTDWHEDYKRRYAELKKKGKSFFPHAVFKDTLVSFLILCALAFLAIKFVPVIEDLADPTDTTFNPRPEWYFLFLFQALKLFPGKFEAVAAVVLPGVGVTLLFLLPFLDRSPRRHPLERPFMTTLGVLALVGWGYLTWAGFRAPMTNPVVEKDPLVLEGQRLYRDLNCAYCHRIAGKGGTVGPAIEAVGAESDEWLERHFRDPQAVNPGSPMPKLNLLDDEIKALVAYIKSLGSGPYTPEAVKLFSDNCAACHKIGKEGGDIGPDLSLIGTARDKAYIRKYVVDPSQLNAASNMPGFLGQLTDIQIEDIARYLASLKGQEK